MAILVEDLRIRLDPGAAMARLRLGRSGYPEARVREIAERVNVLARPRAVFAPLPVGVRGAEWVEVGSARLHSAILARCLEGADRAFPYVVTLGLRFDEEARRCPDPLDRYCFGELANLALSQAQDCVRERIADEYHLPHIGSLSPGTLPDWPLEEQRGLFSLLGDVEAAIGVRLTDQFLMTPRKSLSGLFFPSPGGVVPCRFCPREGCPARKEPYDPGA